MKKIPAIQVHCGKCKSMFVPVKYQLDDIIRFGKIGVTKLRVECTKCGKSVNCDPFLLVHGGTLSVPPADTQSPPSYRCPVSGCAGWVSYIDQPRGKSFWGCGECSNIWRTKSSLDKAIDKIVKIHKHRSACYTKSSSGWIPTDLKSQPANYERIVERENDT